MITTGTSPVESPPCWRCVYLIVSHASHGHKARGGGESQRKGQTSTGLVPVEEMIAGLVLRSRQSSYQPLIFDIYDDVRNLSA